MGQEESHGFQINKDALGHKYDPSQDMKFMATMSHLHDKNPRTMIELNQEQMAYTLQAAIYFADLLLHNDTPNKDFDNRSLKRGMKVEKKEHTSYEFVARKIAKDHLLESEDYYKHLEEMEQKFTKTSQ